MDVKWRKLRERKRGNYKKLIVVYQKYAPRNFYWFKDQFIMMFRNPLFGKYSYQNSSIIVGMDRPVSAINPTFS